MTDTPPVWHALESAGACRHLGTEDTGLTAREAAARLRTDGPNRLPEGPRQSLAEVAIRQFRSPLIYILGVAALVSLAMGELADAGFIAFVLCLNAVFGAWQEWKAEQTARALQNLLEVRAAVERDGETRDVRAEDVVRGDVVRLEAGDRVPADLRLLSAHGLELDESLLTGESAPVAKDPDHVLDPATPIHARTNLAFAGTGVARGRARGVVTATASDTAVGELAADVIGATRGEVPLLTRMARFTRVLGVGVLVAAAAIGLAGITIGGASVSEMFLVAVALAVAAIPEGLPVAMTVALSIATTRMARRGVIVRRLTAVEGLGSCTMIATDKTGTLTCNELTVREVHTAEGARYDVTGSGFEPEGELRSGGNALAASDLPSLAALARAAVLCNDGELRQRDGAWTAHGDAVDVALLVLAHKLGVARETELGRLPLAFEIPFESEQRYAASFHGGDGSLIVFAKGAPERLLPMCRDASDLTQAAEQMATRGLRVLALAAGRTEDRHLPEELDALGLVGMTDPLRPRARDAVRACKRAGIAVAMVTGDHPSTALQIARELDLAEADSEVVVGDDLAGGHADLATQRVFARVGPHAKLQLVQAAQQAGHFVAVTGDGVNDAPALRAANIGVAMGKGGTDVAREAASLVITDDDFATIVSGIEEGRVAYDNIRKVVYMLVSTGGAEIVLVALAVTTGLPLPLLPAQLLWLNLVTQGIQDVGLAFEPAEGDVLRRPPRPPEEGIFNRLMIERTVLAGLVIGGVGFAAFAWMLADGWSEPAARNALLLLMVLFENVHIGNCRSETRSALALPPWKSPILLAGVVAALLAHLVAMHLPLTQAILRVEPVAAGTWLTLGALALTVFPVIELHKLWRRRARPRPAPRSDR